MSNRRIDFSKLGGFGFTQDTLDFLQKGYNDSLGAMATGIGTLLVMHGVQDNGATVSDGWVLIDGELLPFVGGPKSPRVYIDEVQDNEVFADTSTPVVYFTRRARMGNVGPYALSDFRPWKTSDLDKDDAEVVATARAVKKLHDIVLDALGFEQEVILKGCTVSNIAGGNFDVSAGSVLFGRKVLATPAYQGVYPAYLTEAGQWVTVQPGAGLYIAFDPHTSQRYADVIKRATTSAGEIKTFKVLSDRFDANTGLGKWEMLGFKISDDFGSRTMVGLDRRAQDPQDNLNVWDAAHTVVGNMGGTKTHKLTIAEMPRHRFRIPTHNKGGGDGNTHMGLESLNNNLKFTEYLGNDEAHNNMQPYRVVVFAERI